MKVRTRTSERKPGQFPRVGLWRNPDFLALWTGETCSQFGGQITLLALPLTAVVLLGVEPAEMGLLLAAQTAPFLVLPLLTGAWIDRLRKRPILIAANLLRAGLLALIPLLAFLGVLQLWHLIGIGLLLGTGTLIFDLAYFAYLPRLVKGEDLVEANSKLAASAAVAEIGGPGVGGLLVGALTAPFAMVVDACSFLVAAASLARIRALEPEPKRSAERRGVLAEIQAGLAATLGNRYLLAFAGEAATYNVFWNTIQVVLVLFLVGELGIGPIVLGAILSVGSAGALIGSLITPVVERRFGVGSTMIGFAIVSNIGTLLIPFVAANNGVGFTLLAAALFLRGVGMTGCNVQVYAVRQALLPVGLEGRMNGTYHLLTHGFIPLGALLGGVLGGIIGLRPTLFVGAVGLFFSWLWLFCSPVRALHSLSEQAAGQAPTAIAAPHVATTDAQG